jgi:hypothetical protein
LSVEEGCIGIWLGCMVADTLQRELVPVIVVTESIFGSVIGSRNVRPGWAKLSRNLLRWCTQVRRRLRTGEIVQTVIELAPSVASGLVYLLPKITQSKFHKSRRLPGVKES